MGGERVKEEKDEILRQESDRVSPRFLLEPSLSEERRRGREHTHTHEGRREQEHCGVSCVETACLPEECCANKN